MTGKGSGTGGQVTGVVRGRQMFDRGRTRTPHDGGFVVEVVSVMWDIPTPSGELSPCQG